MANKRYERHCLCCGKTYTYCSHCNDFDPTESWKYLYHDKNCMAIANIWYAYRGNEISKEEAKEQMSQYKPNIDEVLKYTSIAAKEIRDIFGIVEEEKTEDTVAEKQVEDIKPEEVNVPVEHDTVPKVDTPKDNKRIKYMNRNK